MYTNIGVILKVKNLKPLLKKIEKTVITPSSTFESSIIFHGIKFDFGLGEGSHGCIKSGIYESDDEYVIYDLDVSSLYPSIAKSLTLYPAHLGPEFTKLYSTFIDDRIKENINPKMKETKY